jgi:glyoxylase-like metal-dependent hydrolase (beta-lactamase superfamily II)
VPEVYADDEVTIEMLPALGRVANNAYIIRPTGGGPVVVVDVPEGSEAIVEALGDAEVASIIVTHSHFDHWGGYDVVRAHTNAPVYASAEETNLDDSRNVQPLADGDAFPVGDALIRVLHTPGHTPGSICLTVGGVVLTGDTLFPGGPGHSRSHEALLQEIESITTKLHPLPAETLVLPGHGDTTTIGAAREEYAVFAAKEHADDLHGDVLWAES